MLLALSALLMPPFAHTTEPSAKGAKQACAAPAPRPLLRKAAYADYAFEPSPDNTAAEKASTGTVRIEIETSGCEVYVSRYLFL
jgi:hypothetical protein